MGQINIGGTSASVQLQGNNTITSDQAFTFPPQGGQLVCYQQGFWTPILVNRTDDNVLTEVSDAAYNSTFMSGWWSRTGSTINIGGSFRLTNKGTYPNGSKQIYFGGFPYASLNVFGTDYGRARFTFVCSSPASGSNTNWNDCLLNMAIQNNSDVSPEQIMMYGTAAGLVLFNTSSRTRTNLNEASITDSFYVTDFGGTYITDDTDWTPLNGATLS